MSRSAVIFLMVFPQGFCADFVCEQALRRKGVGMFGSVLLRREGVRGFGFGIGCSGVIQMTLDGCRQVGVGRIGVGTVTVVTGCTVVQQGP